MTKNRILKVINSKYFYPAILTAALFAVTIFGISGTSMGVYHQIFYGESTKDNALLFGSPKSIRSDEWVVNSQKILSQASSDLKANNTNIGLGENERLINDVPTRDWSVLFKPHNLGFFIMPVENAFAFRWFFMGYLLILSAYLFVLLVLPGRRHLAFLLAVFFFFSPFIQWWYVYGTLGSIYYSLFGMILVAKISNSRNHRQSLLLSSLLSYILVCFALILYPPFQIPCGIALVAFSIGYLLDQIKKSSIKILRANILCILIAAIVSLLIVGIFYIQNTSTIMAIVGSEYPGQRVLDSGGYSKAHLLDSNLSPLLQSYRLAQYYYYPGIGATNQSEASSFIMISLLILPFALYDLFRQRRERKHSWVFITLLSALALFLCWQFIPGLDLIGKITLLDKVGKDRILIGIGLLNFIILVYMIKQFIKSKRVYDKKILALYAASVLVLYLLLDFKVMITVPNFLSYEYAALLALPYPIIVYLFLRKKYYLASIGLVAFSLASTLFINPLYKGLDVLTKNPISIAIKSNEYNNNKRWVLEESIPFENFASVNGRASLSGVYTHPQTEIWSKYFDSPSDRKIYNRYAHVGFSIIRDSTTTRKLYLPSTDHFIVYVNACDEFLVHYNVGYILTAAPIDKSYAPCATLDRTIPLNTGNKFYIYSLSF